ncbi:hypothetical protein PR202_ga18157 [Eleusine coracana subsp. coracana]|uniref:Uncharacterized protein n=1 Tax=Eleusine coracana subsp. coracana TaxID=191504 RepID=A0AAV5CSF3_ELECO|nr:hypothetical protein QOZ80_6AG0508640 [Eleusine coracana subsp. coracana]GJN00930.1 hypothetical protein PR202_ga18157 [Eleusine coracana subsp. coracana]
MNCGLTFLCGRLGVNVKQTGKDYPPQFLTPSPFSTTARAPTSASAMANNNGDLAPSSWMTKAGLGVLTVNSGLAIYRAREDAASVRFVAGSYFTLLILFVCLHAYERAPPGSPARERARRAVWPLTTLLSVGFAWKVAALMPPAVAVLVWVLAIATSVGGFYALYLHP